MSRSIQIGVDLTQSQLAQTSRDEEGELPVTPPEESKPKQVYLVFLPTSCTLCSASRVCLESGASWLSLISIVLSVIAPVTGYGTTTMAMLRFALPLVVPDSRIPFYRFLSLSLCLVALFSGN